MLKSLSFASGKLLFLGNITTGMLVSRGNTVVLVVRMCVLYWDLGSEIRTFVVVLCMDVCPCLGWVLIWFFDGWVDRLWISRAMCSFESQCHSSFNIYTLTGSRSKVLV